jgi:NAD(P)H dehydrogenase (quinone)
MENLLVYADAIRNQSKIFLPYGHGKSAPVCAEDVARVIVGVLVDPTLHVGKTYIPTGPRSLNMTEMAAIFERVLGKPIEYVDLPIAHWTQVMAQSQMTPYLIEYLSRVAEAHQRGELDVQTVIVQRIGGTSEVARRVRRRKPRELRLIERTTRRLAHPLLAEHRGAR